jgi:hypothetical protein
MKNLGVIGNFLMGIVVVSSIFESEHGSPVTPTKFWSLLFLGLAYNILAYESKFGSIKLYKDWSTGHVAIFLIYLLNIICPGLLSEHSLLLIIAIATYHMFLIKKPSQLNIYGFIIGLLVYLYESYELINEPEKSFSSILKLLACILFIVYYYNNIFGSKDKSKDKEYFYS